MDYLRCEISQEKKWLENPILTVIVHFSPEMIMIIDNDFLYEEPFLILNHGTWLVRHWLEQPGTQTTPVIRKFAYSQGTTTEKIKQWTEDYGQAREQLQIFRWRLIKMQRGIGGKPSLATVRQPVQEILEPLPSYNGNFGAKGY